MSESRRESMTERRRRDGHPILPSRDGKRCVICFMAIVKVDGHSQHLGFRWRQ